MKHLLLVLSTLLVLVACSHDDLPVVAEDGTIVVPEPTPEPVVEPTPEPVIEPTPTPEPVVEEPEPTPTPTPVKCKYVYQTCEYGPFNQKRCQTVCVPEGSY